MNKPKLPKKLTLAKETLRMLVALECDRGQGFHLGHPMLPDQLRQLLVAPDSVPAVDGHSDSRMTFSHPESRGA